MSYLVLARKYRPASFAEVAGQEHVTRTLSHAIERDKVAHAFLFCGPRGVGKTSSARIFAKSLNCQEGPTPSPCGTCTSCKEIVEGRSLAVLEIDGASHNSVDNVRELIDSFRSAPPPGSKYKVYIIDEVHMLSTAAFNALLKSLEEPPAHTIFILATTEVHKIPDTVLSRCQQYHFKALAPQVVRKQLQYVAKQEGLTIEDEVYSMIARLSEGSMRDAQTLLDRLQSYCDGAITAVAAGEVLGAVDRNALFSLSQSIFSRQPSTALETLAEVFQRGVDMTLLLKEFVSHFRELLIAKVSGEKQLVAIGVSESDAIELLRQAGAESESDIQDLVDLARSGADTALRSNYPKYALESLVVRMASREKVVDFADLIGSLKAIVKSGQALPAQRQAVKESTAGAAPVKKESSKNRKVVAIAKDQNARLELDWNAFVAFVGEQRGNLMLVEQLKLLKPEVFKLGMLTVHAPDLSLSYFKEAENLQKLKAALNMFKSADWSVDFLSGKTAGAAVDGSIVALEKSIKKEHVKSQTESLSSHPSVASIKKAFPGSTIEKVKIRSK